MYVQLDLKEILVRVELSLVRSYQPEKIEPETADETTGPDTILKETNSSS